MNFLKNQKGLSLIEMLLAVAIFSVAFMITTSIFQNVLEGQRSAISAQNIQESMSYAFEMMSKEIRHAQKMTSENQCGVLDNFTSGNEIYNSNINGLYFRNKDGRCVRYYLFENRLRITRCQNVSCTNASDKSDLPITPDEVKVSNLLFSVIDNDWSAHLTNDQPRVSFTMDVEMAGGKAIHKQPMKLQTTVSSRYYE